MDNAQRDARHTEVLTAAAIAHDRVAALREARESAFEAYESALDEVRFRLGVLEDMLTRLRRRPEDRRAELDGCIPIAWSLYLEDGALHRFWRFYLVRSMEAEGTDSAALMRELWRLQPVRAAMVEADEADPTDLGALISGMKKVRAVEQQQSAVTTMRGRGGRRRAYEAWLKEFEARHGITIPRSRPPGRPKLLESAGIDPPDLGRCLDELGCWLDHLRSAASETRKSSTEHVARTFTVPEDQQRLRQLERLGVATDNREKQLSACYIIEGWDTVPELMRLAREATGTVEEAYEARWQQRRKKLARRLLATLSGGWLTERSIYDQMRKKA
jgi:hypothetical protein